MAKVRVYELAKELNMESTKLVDKLVAGGLNIKNYMSTLDEGSLIRAKEIISGVVSEIIEEQRIRPTVIRRRKKVRIQQEVPTAKAELDAKEEEKVEPKKPETTPEEARPPEVESIRAEGLEEPEEQVEIEEAPLGKGIREAELPSMDIASAQSGAPEAGLPADKTESEVLDEKVAKAADKVKAKPKGVKKKKSDEPARIIKRPEEPVEDVLARRVEEKAVESHGQLIPLQPLETPETKSQVIKEAKKEKPAKKKSEKKAEDIDKKVARPKSTFRRRKKEVYERADLYQGRAPKIKGKRAGKHAREVVKELKQTAITVPKAIKRRIKVQEFITISDLSKSMGTKAVELIKRLMKLGFVANINEPIDFETASIVANESGYELELDAFDEEHFIAETEDRPEDLEPRPPVVTIMGHVDHGKTSLLDYIRKSNIIGAESGGITQHIGAYYVKGEGGDIVFLDTPGHEAFTAMRARGAKVTDLIVLVVAADDGVMPQTKEAINHARAANIPIVVAINKIDKGGADPEKVKRELAELDLAPEEWGGDTIFGHISAKTGQGINELLGLILLQSEMLELKGSPNKAAIGTIVEAKLDKSKGPVATVLIKNGTLNQGDCFICGEHYGRVRAMLDHHGRKMKSAGPSVPTEIYGISGVPLAGEEFIVVQDEKTAKQIIEYRRNKSKKQAVVKRGVVSLDDLFEKMKEGEVKELNIVLKTDVQGSLEALGDALHKLHTEEVKLKIIHSATGAITESDIMLASASGAIIIGFNVRANPRVYQIAERERVDIKYYDVIYNVIKDIRLAMTGLLEPVYEEHITGRADVKETFYLSKGGHVAGCHITDGHVERNANIRLLRDDVVIYDGKISSLRRFKEDVKEVQSGYECGIGLGNFGDTKPGDVLEVYQVEEVEAEL